MIALRKIVTARSGLWLWLLSAALLADFANLIDFHPHIQSYHFEDADFLALSEGFKDHIDHSDAGPPQPLDFKKYPQARKFIYDLDSPLHANNTAVQDNHFDLLFLTKPSPFFVVELNKILYLLNCTFRN